LRGIAGIVLATGAAGCNRPPEGQAALRPPVEQPAVGPAESAEPAVVLDSATILRIGLRTVVLARSARMPERELSAEVVEDPGATTAVRTGVGGRLMLAAERPWPGIGDHLERGVIIAQVGDARPIEVARSGTVVRVLAQPGELVQAGQDLLDLVDDSTVLVRVAADGEVSRPPATLALARPGGGTRVAGRYVGPAATADPVTRGPAWLYRVPGDPALRPGVVLLAYLAASGTPNGALFVPADAVVQWDALAWMYLERSPGRFVRVRLPTDRPVAGGWLAAGEFSAGDRVVVTGAGQLLSEEFRARISVGQEVGE
jgi:hypothetical protein